MSGYTLTNADIAAYRMHLMREERSTATMEKYMRTIRRFQAWLRGRAISKELLIAWKKEQQELHAASTVNAAISALNGLFRVIGRPELHIRFLKLQRRAFRDRRRELTQQEYEHLIHAARLRGQLRLALLMETICATGIRVSEVRYITVEAVRTGCVEIVLKGKVRTILLPAKLCRKLLKFAIEQKIAYGAVFRTESGKAVSRGCIWSSMKRLCRAASVEPSKVFPHNLRHLFATVYYRTYKDIVKLADVLGHSSMETTRIYLLTSGEEHCRQLEQLGLVL